MENEYFELIDIIEHVKSVVNFPDTDVIWSGYENVEELLVELDNCILRLKNRDKDVIHDLIILFAPTGSLQEISLSNGWGSEFINISLNFDNIIRKIIKSYN